MAAAIREFAGVVQEIADDLRQSRRVRAQIDEIGRECDRQLLTSPFGERTHRIDGVVDD